MPKVKRKCKHCNKEFMTLSRKGRGKYCSKECFRLSRVTSKTRTCKQCGKEFLVWLSKIKRGHGKYCSIKCKTNSPEYNESIQGRKPSAGTRHKMSIAKVGKSGKEANNWRGGTAKTTDGRVLVYCPDHPHANNMGYVLRYRLAMETHIGRVLLPTEVVHHINGIKDDDRIENLMLFSNNVEHLKYEREA